MRSSGRFIQFTVPVLKPRPTALWSVSITGLSITAEKGVPSLGTQRPKEGTQNSTMTIHEQGVNSQLPTPQRPAAGRPTCSTVRHRSFSPPARHSEGLRCVLPRVWVGPKLRLHTHVCQGPKTALYVSHFKCKHHAECLRDSTAGNSRKKIHAPRYDELATQGNVQRPSALLFVDVLIRVTVTSAAVAPILGCRNFVHTDPTPHPVTTECRRPGNTG